MTNETVEQMIALLKTPELCDLRRLADEHPLPWAEFVKLKEPAGITQGQAWDILNTLRRQTAIELPFRDGEGRCGWYYPTRSIEADLDEIDKRCHAGSLLDLAIKSRNTTYFLIEAHVADAITIVQEDGLAIGYEKAREVLLGEREPENSGERLLLNGHQAIWDLDDYAERPCTPELIFEMYEKISKGVDDQTTPSRVQQSLNWKRKRLDSLAALSLVAKLVEENREGYDEHPLLLGMAVRHIIMSTLPLPSWNGTMYSLLMKLLFKKSHLPVLAFVPLVKTCREWESGILRPPSVMASLADSEVLIGNEVDYTIYVGVMAHLARQRLDEVENELKRVIKRDEAFVQALRDDVEINHRQRAVLQVALSNPEAVFKIESHQMMHKVAYATARADLLKLAELGFLRCVRSRRAFEFRVTPGLRQLLMDHAKDEES
ncbi:hypothetical protein [Raoultibacter massiliensis]|uniref:hypothetical protein n=1 Tax=Raoultibacter massiliensis TaxID=1852371 RepID=UPI003A8FCBC2